MIGSPAHVPRTGLTGEVIGVIPDTSLTNYYLRGIVFGFSVH
jgi:hypothetical protein